jgi:Ni/Co efflux regulator RcnB
MNQRDFTERNLMKKLIAVLFAALFAAASFQAVAQDKKAADKKPTAEECKKDPKMKGCEPAKK